MKQHLLMCSIIGSSILLAACSTPVKQAGAEHATTISKWNELARYAESDLRDFSIAITAQLMLEQQEGQHVYQLRNIKLSQKENSYTLNLLAPEFEHKYICNPVCYQLLEYVENSPVSGSTLLNEYFSLHEFELFSFYGELYKLNDQLTRLKHINEHALTDYLRYIKQDNRQFNDLAGFALYLASQLSEDQYQRFLNDPNALEIRQKSQQFSGLYKVPEAADVKWLGRPGEFQPETEQWSSASQAESVRWSTPLNFRHNTAPQNLSNSPAQAGDWVNGNWLLAKNESIRTNDYVCSSSDNKFGRVSKLSEQNVHVELVGQAKILQDGIFYDLAQGALFNGQADAITFVPLSGSQSFSLLSVAACHPQ